jgi:hypothetical protein
MLTEPGMAFSAIVLPYSALCRLRSLLRFVGKGLPYARWLLLFALDVKGISTASRTSCEILQVIPESLTAGYTSYR